ncbi:MAG: toxin secretion, membrane fusion protein [Anaerolinea sp.]|nr:toxin secretion, membrane fusion protein [Anaerolinea sp.]
MNRKIATVVQKTSLSDQGHDFAYWQTQPYEKRIEALEEIRNEYKQWDQSSRGDGVHVQPGFQRVFRIIKR